MDEKRREERRNNPFIRGIQLANIDRTDGNVSYIGDRMSLATPQQRINHRKLSMEAQKKYDSISPEKKEAKLREYREVFDNAKPPRQNSKKVIRRPDAFKKNKKFKGSRVAIVAAIVAAMAAGTIVIGGQMNNKEQSNPITIEQALESGTSLKELAITPEMQSEIEEIQNRLNSIDVQNMSDSELRKLGLEIDNLQLNEIFKSKVGNALGVEPEQIEVSYRGASGPDESDSQEKFGITVKNDEGIELTTYNGDNIPEGMKDYIRNIGEVQGAVAKIENENFDRDSVLDTYKTAMDETSRFAAGKVKYDGKTFTLEQESEKDLAEQTTYEIADDGDER